MSSDKKAKYQEVYYENFKELLDNLSIIRPKDSSLMLFKSAMTMYISAYGIESLVQNMNLYIEGYTAKILKKDESFFLNELENDFSDQTFIVNEIKKIKEIWIDPATTEHSKEIIWKHFRVFAKLSKFV